MTDPSWQPALAQALAAEDRAALRRVPKTDLHCHGLLSAPRQAYEQLLGHPIPAPPPTFADFTDFVGYILTHLLPALHLGPEAIRTLVRAAFERTAEDGAVYTEMSFDLFLPDTAPGLSLEMLADILREEAARVADRITVAPEIGIDRSLPIDEILPRLRRALATGVWRSIDLYADERRGSVRDFVRVYRLAAEHGLKLKAHAGELCGADVVRESVEVLGLHAVQHGVRAGEDPALVAHLAERGVILNICPTSNHSLGVCGALDGHPAPELFAQGVRLTVNTDDFTLFGAGVSDELLTLKRMGFTSEQIARIVDNGLREGPVS